MDELFRQFSSLAQSHLQAWWERGQALDEKFPAHKRIFVNEEGFMESAPGPSERVQGWTKEYLDRQTYYEASEIETWLKKERERVLGWLQGDPGEMDPDYYRYWLTLIRQLIKENQATPTPAEDPHADRITDLIKDNELNQAGELLEKLLARQKRPRSLLNELILHLSNLDEVQDRERQNVISLDDATRIRARVKLGLLAILDECLSPPDA